MRPLARLYRLALALLPPGLRRKHGLFVAVCGAVHYAHSNLIVHRDLKSSNILVDPEGRPRLLDFGIARLLEAPAGSVADPATRTGARLMTPECASPEQVRGEPASTASDVYQLGLLLFELLTGRSPYPLAGRPLHEVVRVICEEPVDRPSAAVAGGPEAKAAEASEPLPTPEDVARARRTTAQRLRRRLRGDLDNIVSMALRKEPERRYPSADRLGEDVQPHLQGLPVRARPDTFLYRGGKFARRHRLAVASLATIFVLVAGSAAAVASQAGRIARERDRAEQALAFLVDLFEAFEPAQARGAAVAAPDILRRSERRVRAELGGQPLMQARMLARVGQAYQIQGMYAEAEAALEEALAIRLRHLGWTHTDVAESQLHLAELRHAMGDYGAEALYRAALATYGGHQGDEDRASPRRGWGWRSSSGTGGTTLRPSRSSGSWCRLSRQPGGGGRSRAPGSCARGVGRPGGGGLPPPRGAGDLARQADRGDARPSRRPPGADRSTAHGPGSRRSGRAAPAGWPQAPRSDPP